MDPCNKCRSTKKQSPSSLSSLQEPSSKRATLLPPSYATTTFPGDHRILGFSKLPLPANALSSSSPPALGRTISDPINSPGASSLSDQAPKSLGNFLNNLLPESYAVNSVATSPSQSVSTVQYLIPLQLLTRWWTTASSGKESHAVTSFLPWWNEVIKEGEEDSGSEDIDTLPKDESEVSEAITESEERPFEEAVWVDRNGEWQRLSDSSLRKQLLLQIDCFLSW